MRELKTHEVTNVSGAAFDVGALVMNLITGKTIRDFYNGLKDLEQAIIKDVSYAPARIFFSVVNALTHR
jgi:hypothetical protein